MSRKAFLITFTFFFAVVNEKSSSARQRLFRYFFKVNFKHIFFWLLLGFTCCNLGLDFRSYFLLVGFLFSIRILMIWFTHLFGDGFFFHWSCSVGLVCVGTTRLEDAFDLELSLESKNVTFSNFAQLSAGVFFYQNTYPGTNRPGMGDSG